MKKRGARLLRILFQVLLMVGWPVGAWCQNEVNFADPTLETAVRAALGKPTGLLTRVDLLSLTNLFTPGYPTISNLMGLEAAVNLETLDLNWNTVSDLGPLAGLTNLSSLQLNGNSLSNCSGLSGLTNLMSLSLSSTPLQDIGCLSHLEKLVALSLAYSSVTHFSPLIHLAALQSLDLSGSSKLDCAHLSGLVSLTNLAVSSTSLSNVTCLSGLTNLTELNLANNQVGDLSSLAGLSRLQNVYLSGNPLGNCASLASWTNLGGSLDLCRTSLTNIAGLSKLVRVSSLDLSYNPISELGPLAGLTNLASLRLNYTGSTNYPALTSLTNLHTLQIHGNSIKSLSSLPPLPLLSILGASWNRFANLNGLESFPMLNRLDLSYNRLTNINGLLVLTNFMPSPVFGWVDLRRNLLDLSPASEATNVIQTVLSRGATFSLDPQNQPPVISTKTNWVIPANEAASLRIYVADDVTPGSLLTLSVSPTNQSLLSAGISSNSISTRSSGGGVVIPAFPGNSCPPLNAYLNVVPGTNQTGTVTLTLTATDDTQMSNQLTISVTVLEPSLFDGTALNNSNLTWRTFGLPSWFIQTNVAYTGRSAAQSGGSDSWLEAQITGPGLLTYWWMAGLGDQYSYAGVMSAQCSAFGLSGSVSLSGSGWQKQTLSFPAGTWTVRWQSVYESQPLWLDEVRFVPGPPVCWLEAPWPPYSWSTVMAHGAPGETYDIERSSDLKQWTRLDRITLRDFEGFFWDTNVLAATMFYRLHGAVLAPIWFEVPSLTNGQLQLAVHSDAGQPLRIESSTNLVNWEALFATNNALGILHISTTLTNSSSRFFRAKALPWGPVLNTPQAPIIWPCPP